MQHLENPRVGQIVHVLREDRGGHRIPLACRNPVGEKIYCYRAEVVEVNPDKRYHKVRVLSWNENEGLETTYIRKAYKSKMYS